MGCCNPHRLRVDLHCEIGSQLTCWALRLAWLADFRPADVAQKIEDGLQQFDNHLVSLRRAAKRINQLDLFVQLAAHRCASLATKTDRRLFREQLVGAMSQAELERFDGQMAAEWSRLRGKANPTK